MKLTTSRLLNALKALILGALLSTVQTALGQMTGSVEAVAPGPWISGQVSKPGEATLDESELASFWTSVQETGTPVIERNPADDETILVTFVARSPPGYWNAVPAVHGPYGWHDLYPMDNVPNTDIWMKTLRFPATAVSAYWITWPRGRVADPGALDVFTVFKGPDRLAREVYGDPLSRHHATFYSMVTGKTGQYSWFAGPDAPPQPYLEPGAGIPRGRIETRVFESKLLNNARDISIYTPPGYGSDESRAYPLLLMFDRDEYLATVRVPEILDRMISADVIPPVVAVFIDVISYEARGRELPGNSLFQQFIHDELLSTIEREFRLTKDPMKRVVAGASYGGLCATLIARRYPGSFGAVLAQSGSFWWGPEFSRPGSPGRFMDYGDVPRWFAEGPRLPIRFSLDVGLLEPEMQIHTNRHLRDVLVAKGYEVDYMELMGAHDWIAWRSSLPDRLVALLGKDR